MTQPVAPTGSNAWIIGTRKGAWSLVRDGDSWRAQEPWFFGCQTHHVVQDPRGHDPLTQGTILAAVRTGHLGPTVYRSTDGGATWKEAAAPPAFPPAEAYADSGLAEDDARRAGRSVKNVFYLAPGHASEPGVWYAGTCGTGLFRSDDDGVSWAAVEGFNDNPLLAEWTDNFTDGSPVGALTHSVQVDPDDPAHLLLGLSSGGVFISEDRGGSWRPVNSGAVADFMPPKDDGTEYEYGHDPHDVVIHPANGKRWYHQNHCGIYRLDWQPDAAKQKWVRIGDNMPKDTGDIGFPMTCHPRDPDTCWVVPMDGSTVWPRTSVGGKPAVFRTRDGGDTWERQDRGFPATAWYTVLRQAMAHDGGDPLGLALGTTSGDVWASADEGGSWRPIATALPQIFSVTAARLPG